MTKALASTLYLKDGWYHHSPNTRKLSQGFSKTNKKISHPPSPTKENAFRCQQGKRRISCKLLLLMGQKAIKLSFIFQRLVDPKISIEPLGNTALHHPVRLSSGPKHAIKIAYSFSCKTYHSWNELGAHTNYHYTEAQEFLYWSRRIHLKIYVSGVLTQN